ncbi:hypothetical protein ABGB19_25065 [Mycobacterium sp. B14F4]|uniref:hypothetical protein n=1 Tax=Mycobacterium sp. B14F4 TaxID=3153565 RepID=UPI00325E13CD
MFVGAARASPRLDSRLISGCFVVSSLAAGAVVIGLHGRLASRFGIPDIVALAVLVASTLPPLLYPIFLRFHRTLGPVAGLAMVLTVAVAQPRFVAASMRNPTSGSDQAECIIVGLTSLSRGQWPYDATEMSKRNPMSCGPLWLITHWPAAVTGYSVAFGAIMIGALMVIGFLNGWATTSRLLVMLSLTPATWLSLIVGSDFLTFGLCTAAFAAVTTSTSPALRRVAIPASLLVAHFRLPFAGLPAAIFLRRNADGRLLGLRTATFTTVASVAFWALLYVVDAERYVAMGPMHVIGKVEVMTGTGIDQAAAVVTMIMLSAVLALVCSRLSVVSGITVFCAVMLIPMALANGYQMLRYAYPHWEGAFWLVPLVALTAFALADRPIKLNSPRRPKIVRR